MRSSLLAALDLTKRQLKLISLAAVATAWAAGSVLLLLIFVLWDHWHIGGVPGWAASLLRVVYLIATAAWLIVAVALPWVRQISDLYAARLIERGHPELGNMLVGAVQVARHEELPGSVRVAVFRQASRQVSHADTRGVVPRSALRRGTAVFLAVVASFIGYSIVAPKSVMVSVRRALGAHLAPPTRTIIVEAEPTHDLRVLRGEDVPFRVKLRGEVPREVTVQFSPDGGKSWPAAQQIRLVQIGRDRTWAGARYGADVQTTMLWQVLAGDARSEPRSLVVVPEPVILDVQTRYEYPRYTGWAPTTQPGGDIDAIIGTKASIEAHANVAAYQPVLVAGEAANEQRRILPQPPASQPSTMLAEWAVLEDSAYYLQFRDRDGHTNAIMRYKIHARPDRAPIVDWEGSADSIEVDAGEPFLVSARASDDFVVKRAVLGCRKTVNQHTHELPLVLTSGGAGEYTIRQSVRPARLGLAAGDTADLWITVWDNREDAQGQPAPQRADSPIRRVLIRKNPTSAPAVAQKQESPVKETSRTRPAESPASEAEAKDSEQAARHDRKEKRTLQEFMNEHEKELALIEHKLEDEMKNEGGGREEAQVPDVVPDQGSRASSRPAQGDKDGQPQGSDKSGSQQADSSAPRPASEGDAEKSGTTQVPHDLNQQRRNNAGKSQAASSTEPADTGKQANADSKQEDRASNKSQHRDSDQSKSKAESGEKSEPPDHKQEPSAVDRNSANTSSDAAASGQNRREDDSGLVAAHDVSEKATKATDAAASQPGQASGLPDGANARNSPGGHQAQDSQPSANGDAPGTAQRSGQQTGDSGNKDRKDEQTKDTPLAKGNTDSTERQPSGPSSAQGPNTSDKPQQPNSDGSQSTHEKKDNQDDQKGHNESKNSAEQGNPTKKANSAEDAAGAKNEGAEKNAPGEKSGESKKDGATKTESGEKKEDAAGQSAGKDQGQAETKQSAKATSEQPNGDATAQGTESDKGQGASQEPGKNGSAEGSGAEKKQGDSTASGRNSTGDAPGQGSEPGSGKAGKQASAQDGSGESSGTGQKPGDAKTNEPGQVGPGSPTMGYGGREGGVSNSLPDATQPAEDVAAPQTIANGSTPLRTDGRVDKLVDTLERQLRAGTVDPALLQDLGWDLPRARQFVEDYRRTRQGGQRQVLQTLLPSQRRSMTQPAGDSRVVRGTLAATPGRAFQSDVQSPTDPMRGAADAARQRVPARYRSLLEAYYRSITSQPAQ